MCKNNELTPLGECKIWVPLKMDVFLVLKGFFAWTNSFEKKAINNLSSFKIMSLNSQKASFLSRSSQNNFFLDLFFSKKKKDRKISIFDKNRGLTPLKQVFLFILHQNKR